jgi:hypothetical protein
MTLRAVATLSFSKFLILETSRDPNIRTLGSL